MTSPTPQTIDPDPKIMVDYLTDRVAQISAEASRELAQSFAALQQTHRRAAVAEQRVAELEQTLAVITAGQDATQAS